MRPIFSMYILLIVRSISMHMNAFQANRPFSSSFFIQYSKLINLKLSPSKSIRKEKTNGSIDMTNWCFDIRHAIYHVNIKISIDRTEFMCGWSLFDFHIFVGTYLAQFFAFMMWQKWSQTLKASIDALHSSSFIAVCNFASHALFAFHDVCVALTTTVFSV